MHPSKFFLLIEAEFLKNIFKIYESYIIICGILKNGHTIILMKLRTYL